MCGAVVRKQAPRGTPKPLFPLRIVSPTGCNSEKYRVGTRNLGSELDGAYWACKPHRMQFWETPRVHEESRKLTGRGLFFSRVCRGNLESELDGAYHLSPVGVNFEKRRQASVDFKDWPRWGSLGELCPKLVRFTTKRSLWEPFWEGGRSRQDLGP